MRFEGREVAPRQATVVAIRAALEAAGVEFIAENGGGPGVRLARSGMGASAVGRPTTRAAPEPSSVGPEDEARGGHEAPAPGPGPTVPGTDFRRSRPRKA